MDPVRAFERHAAGFRSRLKPALRIAFWAALLAGIVLAGALGRRGTLEARALSFALLAGVILAFFARSLHERRSLRRHDRLVRRVVLGEDPVLGAKVLRALELSERAQVDPVRPRDGQAADRAVRVAEMHYRPLKSGSRFSMKAAIPSFWSSEAKSR